MNTVIKKELTEILTNSFGNILCIGLNDKELLNIIDNNSNIIKCDILNNNSIGMSIDNTKGPKSQTISIKNIKKIFKKKKTELVICDYKHINKYLKSFTKDIIYITKGNVIMYGKFTNLELEKLIRLYNRYEIKNTIINEKNNYIIKFEINNIKTNKLKDFGYLIIDFLSELYDVITDLLVS